MPKTYTNLPFGNDLWKILGIWFIIGFTTWGMYKPPYTKEADFGSWAIMIHHDS
jgi:hypothetical protein